MELQAAIEALGALKQPCEVEFFTDSEYVQKGVTSWLALWKANGWRTKKKRPVKNEDLWRALDSLAAKHSVTWSWLKGHAGHDGNERCDALANEQIAKIKNSLTPDQLRAELDTFLARDGNGDDAQGELL
jgi:ribonuclease HI